MGVQRGSDHVAWRDDRASKGARACGRAYVHLLSLDRSPAAFSSRPIIVVWCTCVHQWVLALFACVCFCRTLTLRRWRRSTQRTCPLPARPRMRAPTCADWRRHTRARRHTCTHMHARRRLIVGGILGSLVVVAGAMRAHTRARAHTISHSVTHPHAPILSRTGAQTHACAYVSVFRCAIPCSLVRLGA